MQGKEQTQWKKFKNIQVKREKKPVAFIHLVVSLNKGVALNLKPKVSSSLLDLENWTWVFI